MIVNAKFNHFNINVTDLERSLDFYRRALNLEPSGEINSEDGSFKIVYLRDNRGSDFRLELTWLRDHPQPYNLGECEFHLCLTAPGDYEAVRAYHKQEGWVCYENHDMGIYFIVDPDGYWIEIIRED
ncbi:MAG: VOC family protein [Bacteroidaceae bacterium]|nr:VOC family protein [Bacteroidaceae bacterium]